MELIKVLVVFAIILVVLNKKYPLYMGMICGMVATALLFQMPLAQVGKTMVSTITGWSVWEVALAMFVITVLQTGLDKRKHFNNAQTALNGLMKDPRLNTAIASVVIGMMPGPATVTICGKMIDNMAGEHLKNDEKAAVSMYLRHIPEGMLPTFPGIIVACGLSGISVSSFFLYMLPMLPVLIAAAYIFYLRKVPKVTTEATASKAASLKLLIKSLWTLFLAIVVIVVFNLDAWIVVAVIAVINIFTDHLSMQEVKECVLKGLEYKTMLGIFATFFFKDILISGGVIDVLPQYFSKLPIPSFLILGILFFFGTLVASSNASCGAFLPLAYTMLPTGGTPLLVLMMGFGFCASQISPVHICLPIIVEYFNVSMFNVVKKILPMCLLYVVILCGYYLLLTMFV